MIVDFGGDGHPLVLLHGIGGSAAEWRTVAACLTPSFRTLALDLPGHGSSPHEFWSFDRALRDIAALELGDPVVVGHSLGGMVALRWGRANPGAPGVISLDGHRFPITDTKNYPGLSPARVVVDRDRLHDLYRELSHTVPRRKNVWGEIFSSLRHADIVESLPDIQCPTLLVLATGRLPGTEAFTDLLDAYGRGVDRDVTRATTIAPHLTVRRVDTSHALVAERPEEIAGIIHSFATVAVSNFIADA
ncbi:alpha/beta fold hydrolase [Pseudonocardia sp. HH130629-09]|uniref:alpha/beta fold hydrolase n=1 Tax=Pseudonocardia sp. HH130629-09 TaxID=1641402 RepID=UPI0009EA1631|nr:alpha/beta hydrolase [Pseudonocardia sp. HH130629-09]